MSEEEKKYKNVISALKALPKVKAKDDFDQKLYRKLRDVESERMSPSFEKLTRPAEKNWIFSIFRPAFVPAIGITIALIAVIVIYITLIPRQETTITQNEQQTQKQELVIKKPATGEEKDLSAAQENQPPITHELSKSEFNERSTMPVSPKSDVGTEAPSVQPEERVSEPPEIEQKLEKKTPVEDEMKEKELRIEKKVGDMKKNQNDDLKKTEEQNQEKKVDEGKLNGLVKPSMGVDKNKAKDTVKTDSIRSKKESGKDIEKNKGEVEEQKKENDKQAEPKQQEPTEEKK